MTYNLIYWLFAILLVCLRVALIEENRASKRRVKDTDGESSAEIEN